MRTRALLFALLVAVLLAAWLGGLDRALEPERLRALVAGAGPWGPVLFVALFAVLEALGVPGALFMLAAAAVWPPWTAFLLNWLGGVGAGIVGFAFARTLGREWLAARLPERVRRFERRVERHGLRTVILFRLTFFLFPPAHWALGLSPVGLAPFLAGTAIGLAPGIALWSFGGSHALDWLSRQPPGRWAAAAALLVAALAAHRLWARRRAPQAREAQPGAAAGAGTPVR